MSEEEEEKDEEEKNGDVGEGVISDYGEGSLSDQITLNELFKEVAYPL